VGAIYRDLVRKHSKAKGSARALLNILADYANDDGLAWPGRAALANDAGMSERNVVRCIQKLCEDGRLIVEENAVGGRGKLPVYRITFPDYEKGDKLSPFSAERVTNAYLKGDNLSIKGDKCVTIPSYARSEPYLEPKEEPIPDDEDKRARAAHGSVFKAWAENIPGTMTPILGDKLHDLIDECGPPAVIYGIVASVEAGARNFKYIAACARNHAAGREPPVKAAQYSPVRGDGRATSKVAGSLAAMADYEEMKARLSVGT
jgi:hypothetical protein